MKLEFESGVVIPSPTESDLARIAVEEFAILISDNPNTYLQCAKEPEPRKGYVLEYQNGSLDQHFNVVGGAIVLERIVAAFSKYLLGDGSWLTDFDWERMDLP